MTSYFEPDRTYGVELLCKTQPSIVKARLLAQLRLLCSDIEPLDGNEREGTLAFVHTRQLVSYRDGEAPAQAFVAITDRVPDAVALEPVIQQSWRLPGAADVVASCTYTVLVTDLMASGLAYQTRFDLFQRILRGVLTTVPCDAIHWVPAEQIVAQEDYLTSQAGSLADLLGGGPINVRFFNIASGDGEMLMDTRGLAAFGLPDLQCHFRLLDPQQVARLLYNTAFYLYQNGDVIADGHTISGIDPGSKWICQHEDSLVSPDRVVLDLDPGGSFAAGSR